MRPCSKENRETEEEQYHCKLCEGKQLSKERPNLGNTIPKKLHYEADITFCCCS
jgi:DNA-directed RNA polymerase subunit RPC12/RpoP